MTTKSPVGWLILVAALAVPGLMFYGWWSRVNSAADGQMAQKVRRRLPGGGGLFAVSPPAAKLINPIAGQAPAAPPPPAKAVKPAAPARQLAAPPKTEKRIAAHAISTAAATAAAALTRDPTLSPYDAARLAQMAEARTMSQEEVLEASRKTVRRKPRIEATIDLQGIITNPASGNRAIVNGEMVGEGQLVGKVKVLKITSQKVVFSYKGKTFVKVMAK